MTRQDHERLAAVVGSCFCACDDIDNLHDRALQTMATERLAERLAAALAFDDKAFDAAKFTKRVRDIRAGQA